MADGHGEKNHDYHLVDPSPWPLVGSIGAFVLAVGAVNYFISLKAGTPQLWYIAPGFADRLRHHVLLVARCDP